MVPLEKTLSTGQVVSIIALKRKVVSVESRRVLITLRLSTDTTFRSSYS